MANEMWGGRFSERPADIMQEINASISFDKRLAMEDVEGSLAHVNMLEAQDIINKKSAKSIRNGLNEIIDEIKSGTFDFKTELEDIHMNIEAKLAIKIGDDAGRLHTARSRNDQVATDFKLWVRNSLDLLDILVANLQMALAEKALEHAGTIMPGFTHLQSAQPVTFGHHLLAYVEMLGRDRGRVLDCRKRLNECPLGSAALAGTSFPIDRFMVAKELGFDKPTDNSLDSVSDRDFALEALSLISILSMHLSRFAEEIVIWTSAQFSFIKLSDKFTTGSSIMPQKRNPDAAELVRAKTGRIFGSLFGLLTVMKGLTLAYAKDMQEDKEKVFDAFDAIFLSVNAITGMVKDMEPEKEKMRKSASMGYSTATDLADWLVRELKIPFREAHHITGRIVHIATIEGRSLESLELEKMQSVDTRITREVFSVLGVVNSVKSRKSHGGTAPENVKKQARRWLKDLKKYYSN